MEVITETEEEALYTLTLEVEAVALALLAGLQVEALVVMEETV